MSLASVISTPAFRACFPPFRAGGVASLSSHFRGRAATRNVKDRVPEKLANQHECSRAKNVVLV